MKNAKKVALKICNLYLTTASEFDHATIVKKATEIIVEVQREARLQALEEAARECSKVTGDTLDCTDSEDIREWLSERCKRGIEWLMREKK